VRKDAISNLISADSLVSGGEVVSLVGWFCITNFTPLISLMWLWLFLWSRGVVLMKVYHGSGEKASFIFGCKFKWCMGLGKLEK